MSHTGKEGGGGDLTLFMQLYLGRTSILTVTNGASSNCFQTRHFTYQKSMEKKKVSSLIG